MELLEQQKSQCAYTGLPISIGLNAAVDHKLPKSKGGTNDLQNLHWIHSGVNLMKGNMDHIEFIQFLEVLRTSLNHQAGV